MPALAFVLALSGTFVQLALLSVVARLALYMGTAAAVPVLGGSSCERKSTIVLPGGPAIPIAALVLCLAFLAGADTGNLVFGAVAFVVGAGVYALRRRATEPAITAAG